MYAYLYHHHFVAAAWLLLTGFVGISSSYAEIVGSKHDDTLSPYFFIEGGDSDVDRLPLKSTNAEVKLNGFMASVQLTQVYRNEGNHAINASYIFPGSNRAAVNGMTMTIGERRIVAKIKEKQQAQQVFDAAKKAGKTASLLSQKRPNVFSMAVTNIVPGNEVTIILNYTEILSAEQGVYEFVLPGVVGPRYGGDAEHANTEVQWIENPYVTEGRPDGVVYGVNIEVTSPLPISSLHSATHKLTTNWQDKKTLTLSLQDQPNAGNRDFILHYRLQDNQILTGLSRYESGGEDYFLLVAEPPKQVMPEQIPARDYFFVIDVSGSMYGFPLETTKELMANLLRNLTPRDRFNILFFAGASQLLSPQPLAATASNIALAEKMMNGQAGGGGTELYSALQQAFAMSGNESSSRNIVLISDGYISAEQRVFQLIDSQLQRNNVFAFGIGSSVNRFLIEGVATAGQSEAFVVTSQADASRQAQRFNDYISAPVLTNISVTAEGVELYDMQPATIPDLLAQRPIMLIGKYRQANSNASIHLRGVSGRGEQSWSFPLHQATQADSNLPQLWARKKLQRLYVIPEGSEQQQRDNIVELGLRYSLLTRHTSFVAVDETVRNSDANGKNVKQPLLLPQGISNNAVGRPMPEPELFWLGLMACLLIGINRYWVRHYAVGS